MLLRPSLNYLSQPSSTLNINTNRNLIQDEDIEALVEGMQNEIIGEDKEWSDARLIMNRVGNAIRILPDDATAQKSPSSDKMRKSLWHPHRETEWEETLGDVKHAHDSSSRDEINYPSRKFLIISKQFLSSSLYHIAKRE